MVTNIPRQTEIQLIRAACRVQKLRRIARDTLARQINDQGSWRQEKAAELLAECAGIEAGVFDVINKLGGSENFRDYCLKLMAEEAELH